jgi:hypothetical protein
MRKVPTKSPPVFNTRQAAWYIVLREMEEQLLRLPANLSDRAAEIRRFIFLASKARKAHPRSTAGITIARDRHGEFVDVWVSEPGRDRPIVSIVLPVNGSWKLAHARYLESVVPVPDEHERLTEEDLWL